MGMNLLSAVCRATGHKIFKNRTVPSLQPFIKKGEFWHFIYSIHFFLHNSPYCDENAQPSLQWAASQDFKSHEFRHLPLLFGDYIFLKINFKFLKSSLPSASLDEAENRRFFSSLIYFILFFFYQKIFKGRRVGTFDENKRAHKNMSGITPPSLVYFTIVSWKLYFNKYIVFLLQTFTVMSDENLFAISRADFNIWPTDA